MVISRQSQAMLVRSFARNSTGGPRTELGEDRRAEWQLDVRLLVHHVKDEWCTVLGFGVRGSKVAGESHRKHTEVTHLWATDMSAVCLVDGRLAKRTQNRSALSATAAVNMHRSPTSTPHHSSTPKPNPLSCTLTGDGALRKEPSLVGRVSHFLSPFRGPGTWQGFRPEL
jgi:hypothetical protein